MNTASRQKSKDVAGVCNLEEAQTFFFSFSFFNTVSWGNILCDFMSYGRVTIQSTCFTVDL